MENSEDLRKREGVDLSTAKVISETFFVSGSRILVLLLKPIRAFVLGRALGPFLYGIMNIATPYIQILTLSSNIGFNDVLLMLIPRKMQDGDKNGASALFLAGEMLVVFLSSLWYILLLIFSRPILEHWAHQPDALAPFRLYTLITPFLVVNTFYAAVFIAFQRGKLRAKIFLFYGVLSVILPIAAVLWKRDVTVVVAGFVIAEMAGSAVFTILFRKRVLPAAARIGKQILSMVKTLFSKGFLFFFTSLGWNLMNSLDRIMVKFYLPAEYLGFYSISVLFITVLAAFSSTLGQALVPSLAAARTMGDKRVFGNQIRNTSRLGFIAISPIIVIAFALSENIIMLVLPSFEPAITLIQIITFIGVFDLTSRICRAALVADGRSGVMAASYISAAIWNVIWNLILIPRMGVEGAAVASLSSFVILALALHIMTRRISGAGIRFSHAAIPLFLSLVYLLVEFLLPEMGYLPELVIVAVAGTVAYILLLAVTGFVKIEDIERSRESLRDRERVPHVRFALSFLLFLERVIKKAGRSR